MRTLPTLLLLGFLLLSGCAPRLSIHPGHTAALNLGGPVPDIVILAVSGRCTQPCVAPRDNWDYLTSRGTVDRLADTLAAQGYVVQAAGYASHVTDTFRSRYVGPEQRGYAALRRDVLRLRDTWLRAPHPPRLVLLGHSHGATWLHHLSRTHPEVPVALQVDLDSICVAWQSDFAEATRQEDRSDWHEPSPLEACTPVRVQGRTYQFKDIVWPNVARNLEVQSKLLPARPSASGGFPVNYMFDLTGNVRLDGTETGIQRFRSRQEDHSAISYPNSNAMQWVTTEVAKIAVEWRRQDASPSADDR